jgi:hypothetical protein
LGCTSPDPEARYNDFADRTASERGGDATVGPGIVVDFTGTFLMSVLTPLPGADPLRLSAEFDVDIDALLLDVALTPLVRDTDSDGNPQPGARTVAQDPLLLEDIAIDPETGAFVISATDFNIVNEANPISDRPIVAETFSIEGSAQSEDFLCGIVAGQIVEPIALPLGGSTFAAVRTDDFAAVADPPFACPETGGADEAPDAGAD